MARHLALRLEAPLMAFGGEAVDARGVIRDFPAASMLTGLLGNALGLDRDDRRALRALQDRLLFAARIDREPAVPRLTDFQTAKLEKNDLAWTTGGHPAERGGAAGNYESPHLRYRDYLADAAVTVALRLEPAGDPPTLDALAAALRHPARPLFIGRKPCLPSAEIFAGWSEGETVLAALLAVPLTARDGPAGERRAQWPEGEGAPEVSAPPLGRRGLADRRNWIAGPHGGTRRVVEWPVPCRSDSETGARP